MRSRSNKRIVAIVCVAAVLTVGSSAFTLAAAAEMHQIIAEVGSQAHLPCLIGKALFCGEPYFIAWYKFNTSTRTWTRIEYGSADSSSSSQQPSQDNYESPARANSIKLSTSTSLDNGPLTMGPSSAGERIRFRWKQRAAQSHSQQQKQVSRGNNNQFDSSNDYDGDNSNECFASNSIATSAIASNVSLPVLGHPSAAASAAFGSRGADEIRLLFDCATLGISSVDLADEGQYKCEITFSEVLDFEKCPTSTQTRLLVTGKFCSSSQ